jgi:hypothetical protein
VFWGSTEPNPTTGSSSASTRWGRSSCSLTTARGGPRTSGPSGCARPRATYSKKNGVRYLFGAYDVHADRLHGRLRATRTPARCSRSTSRSGCATTPAADLPDRRQPLRAQDAGDPRLGRRRQHRAGLHPDLRQLPEPHRVPLLGDRRVRDQQRRLARLGHAGQGDGRAHPLPQRPAPRPTPDRRRTQAPDHGRLTNMIPGQTFRASRRGMSVRPFGSTGGSWRRPRRRPRCCAAARPDLTSGPARTPGPDGPTPGR